MVVDRWQKQRIANDGRDGVVSVKAGEAYGGTDPYREVALSGKTVPDRYRAVPGGDGIGDDLCR